jgi:hypothetical protein
MQIISFVVALLLDVRAHIPNQPSFGSGPPRATSGALLIGAIAAFLVITAFLSAALWLAVRLTMELL